MGSKSGPDINITPTPPPEIPVDPNLAPQKAKARADQLAALTTQAQGDTAAIMARYGTRLALAGTGTPTPAPAPSPTVAAPAPVPTIPTMGGGSLPDLSAAVVPSLFAALGR